MAIARRSRVKNTAATAGTARPAGRAPASMGYQEAIQQAKAANAEAQARGSRNFAPYRYALKQSEEGDVIILDADLDSAFFHFEHEIDGPGSEGWKNREHALCVQMQENCPLCAKAEADGKDGRVKRASFNMFLSVLDLREFTNKKGEKVPFTKKILCVKQGQIEDFTRALEAAQKVNGGNLRGTHLYLIRGSDQQSARHGKPAPFEDGRVFSIVEEEDLDEYLVDEVKNDKGEVTRNEEYYISAYDWSEIFSEMSAEELETAFGLGAGGVSGPANAAPETNNTAAPSRTRVRARAKPSDTTAEEKAESGATGRTRTRTRTRSKPAQEAPPADDMLDDDIPF